MGAETVFRPAIGQMLVAQGDILYALMLRDVRTRFFGTALGFLVTVAWPLTHLSAIIAIHTAMGRTAPYGSSAALWFATGAVPYIAFSYVSRFSVFGLLLNRPMLAYPIVHVTDILFARVILEILNACLVLLILMSAFWFLDIDFTPLSTVEATKAFLAAVLLGVGFGIFNAMIAAFAPLWATVYALSQIGFWISAGLVFVPSALPTRVVYWLSFNPVFQLVEWERSAFYLGYGAETLDKTYVMAWAIGSIFLGLVVERVLRGKILAGG